MYFSSCDQEDPFTICCFYEIFYIVQKHSRAKPPPATGPPTRAISIVTLPSLLGFPVSFLLTMQLMPALRAPHQPRTKELLNYSILSMSWLYSHFLHLSRGLLKATLNLALTLAVSYKLLLYLVNSFSTFFWRSAEGNDS